jgi:hypothetical protein
LSGHFHLTERKCGQVEVVGLVQEEDAVQSALKFVLWIVVYVLIIN